MLLTIIGMLACCWYLAVDAMNQTWRLTELATTRRRGSLSSDWKSLYIHLMNSDSYSVMNSGP